LRGFSGVQRCTLHVERFRRRYPGVLLEVIAPLNPYQQPQTSHDEYLTFDVWFIRETVGLGFRRLRLRLPRRSPRRSWVPVPGFRRQRQRSGTAAGNGDRRQSSGAVAVIDGWDCPGLRPLITDAAICPGHRLLSLSRPRPRPPAGCPLGIPISMSVPCTGPGVLKDPVYPIAPSRSGWAGFSNSEFRIQPLSISRNSG